MSVFQLSLRTVENCISSPRPDLITEVLETSEEFVLPGHTALAEVVVAGEAAEASLPVTAQSGPSAGAHTAPGPGAAPELGTAGRPLSHLTLTQANLIIWSGQVTSGH